MMVHFAKLILLFAWAAVKAAEVVVNIPGYGKVRGGSGHSFYEKREYHYFHGIYYAKEPSNFTRFLPPIPADPLPADEIYNAMQDHGPCPQPVGSENCLFVNIFTPYKLLSGTSDNEDLLPVMYWIHGGGFSVGGDYLYLPNKYMDMDVVLVEVQYRLGPLGFLSLNTDQVPGNAGILDQIEGLRWVKKFIAPFGGDAGCVTIVGESAGSASVALLLLAPQAKGLFHRVIGESGSMLASWALDEDPVRSSRRIAQIAGCPLDSDQELTDCLRNIDVHHLMKAYFTFEKEERLAGRLGFGGASPVIQVAGKERILEREPSQLIRSGQYNTDVPIMFGANKQDGVIFIGELYNDYLKPNDLQNNEEFLKNGIIPAIVAAAGIKDPDGQIAANFTKKFFYKATMGDFQSMVPGLIDMCSVIFIKEGSYETVREHSRFNPAAYWYSFDYEGRWSLFPYIFFGKEPPIPHGVNHADELIYLFTFPELLNRTEVQLSKRMLSVWTTFAKYGNPTPDAVVIDGVPKFPAYNFKDDLYMSIDRQWQPFKDYTSMYTVTVDHQ